MNGPFDYNDIKHTTIFPKNVVTELLGLPEAIEKCKTPRPQNEDAFYYGFMLEALNNAYFDSVQFPAIKKVIFNDPATIILWADGSKTVVMCGERDTYDPEKGMAMAIARKALGNKGNYYNTFEKWLPKESKVTHSVTVFADNHPIEIVNKKED